MCVWKDRNKLKRGRGWPIFKRLSNERDKKTTERLKGKKKVSMFENRP